MTVVLIILGIVVFFVMIVFMHTVMPILEQLVSSAYTTAASLMSEGLAEASFKHVWGSRSAMLVVYAMRGGTVALLVHLIFVELVRSPSSALTVQHALKVGSTVATLYILALFARACIRAETLVHSVTDLGTGPIVLFLRSFSTDPVIDDSALAFGASGRSEEQSMASLFGTVAPFVALACPTAVPELGAVKVTANNNEWRSTVTSLLSRAVVVVVRLGASASLVWELQLLASHEPRVPVLFLLPKVPGKGEQDSYDSLAELVSEHTPWKFPSAREDERFLFFSARGSPVLLRIQFSGWLTRFIPFSADIDYFASLRPFFEECGIWPRQSKETAMVMERALAAGFLVYMTIIMLLLSFGRLQLA